MNIIRNKLSTISKGLGITVSRLLLFLLVSGKCANLNGLAFFSGFQE